ncbi:urease accessory protein [Monaibacterium marinum]|uniref:Urease accessory protein UreF n=1 Tax=Pontivivens marinum TaxID=1690039 RepID=A0A2C9CQM8_9RHOB|nr:urease accessory UreF family protein [Monaibacterium marinum]SOH93644.1 urease accessory protein [Monaibacterium marinum]
MNTEDLRHAQLLHQWLSPGYPTGAFAWSHGLDRLIDDGEIADAAGLECWLRGVLGYGSGWTDAVLLANAYRAPERADEVAELAAALAPSRERFAETLDQGTGFARVTSAVAGGSETPRAYPVALAVAAAREGVGLDLTLTLYLQAFVANLVSAAVRAVPLGQTDGQRVITALSGTCITVAQAARDTDLTQVGGAAIRADMASLHHETQYSRMFRS